MKQDINLSICGHAWHGKSTLLGKVVAESGMASARELKEAQRMASMGRDSSLVFAQLVFRSKDVSLKESEAARGVTVLPSMVRFEFPRHRITVIDTPGQETYTNNRFFGMFQADCAMVVVDCEEGPKPITHQVFRILKGFEIPLLAVALTKMDRVEYSRQAFSDRADEVRMILEEYGLPHQNTRFIPTSAYAPGRDLFAPGEGILGFDRIDWHQGPSVWEFMEDLTFDTLRPAKDAPLRVVIHGSEVYDHVPGIGKTATALVESGTLRSEGTLQFEPLSAERQSKVTARVRSIQLTRGHVGTPGIPIEAGTPRQLVGIALKNLSEKESLRELFKGRGVVAGTTENPPRVAHRMLLEMTVFDPDTILKAGEVWTLHVHVDRAALQIDAVVSKRQPESGAWEASEDAWLSPGEWGRVEATAANRPIAIEEASAIPQLAKFVLRAGNKAVAFGRCIEILS